MPLRRNSPTRKRRKKVRRLLNVNVDGFLPTIVNVCELDVS